MPYSSVCQRVDQCKRKWFTSVTNEKKKKRNVNMRNAFYTNDYSLVSIYFLS